VLAVPSGAYATIDEAVIADLKKFIFSVFSDVPNKRMEIGRLLGREAAERYLQQCRTALGSAR
jgi:hypothetical protein